MTMISYAQNFEDVLLARCFRARASGFYVDVGAAHPIIDSVTMHFYAQGWHGVNIEPTAHYHQLLAAQRPRDLNLRLAVGAETGEADFYEIEGSGLSTLIAEEAAAATARGFTQKQRRVAVKPLRDIFAQAGIKEIDFLKIDVEGAEAMVLRSNDWQQYRPKIVLVESTKPNQHTPAWDEWESFLLAQEYEFLWFDGLNRFYAAREHAENMRPHFQTPPNVFDDFQRHADMEHALHAEAWQKNFVARMLGPAAAEGIEYDRDLLHKAWPRGAKRQADVEDITYAYQTILGRAGDPDGIRNWEGLIAGKKLRVTDLINAFIQSDEYRKKRAAIMAQYNLQPSEDVSSAA